MDRLKEINSHQKITLDLKSYRNQQRSVNLNYANMEQPPMRVLNGYWNMNQPLPNGKLMLRNG